jgi:3-dehydroquinate synthetase
VRIHDTFRAALQELGERESGRRLFVVVDSNLLRRNPDCLRALPVAARRDALAVRGGEPCKSLRRLEALYRAARSREVDRDTLVLAVGGGSLGDLTGFFAATWMRGIPWATVATTPLAMADSALGGKTAVDWGGLKNPVGAFHPPRHVYGVQEALRTLPARHRRAGLAEVLKSAVIGSRRLYGRLGRVGAELARDPDHADWIPTLRAAAAVKGRIVRVDPYERGRRALLNFGHSFGHALEVSHRPPWLHGEAVGVGMLAAVELSCRKGLCDARFRPELARLLHGMGLPTRTRTVDARRFWSALAGDKKSRAGRIRLVLTEGPGSATFGHTASRPQLEAVLRTLGG